MIPLPESELSAIAARADAATPGPWEAEHESWLDCDVNEMAYGCRINSPLGGVLNHDAYWPVKAADRAFLAAARSDVLALVAEVRRLQALLAPAPGGEGDA